MGATRCARVLVAVLSIAVAASPAALAATKKKGAAPKPGAGASHDAPASEQQLKELRGFGNLLILDHGGGYMSLYAYNEGLLRRVGDKVRAGDPVANVGASGSSADSGLYFELRREGKTFDPLQWTAR